MEARFEPPLPEPSPHELDRMSASLNGFRRINDRTYAAYCPLHADERVRMSIAWDGQRFVYFACDALCDLVHIRDAVNHLSARSRSESGATSSPEAAHEGCDRGGRRAS